MKLFYKFLFFVLFMALAAPMFLKGPDGKPLMRWQDWIPDTGALQQNVQGLVPGDGESPAPEAGGKKVYKWQDQDGTWHYSDRPEDGAGNVEVMEFKATKPPPSEPPPPTVAEAPQPAAAAPALPQVEDKGFSPFTISMDQLKQLLNDVKNMQSTIDGHEKKLQEAD